MPRALGAPIRNRGCETKRRGDNMRIRRAHYENLIAPLPRATFHAPRVQRAASASVKRRAAEEVSLHSHVARLGTIVCPLCRTLIQTYTLSAVQYALDSQHSSLVLGPLDVGDAKSSSSPPADERLRHLVLAITEVK